MTIEYSSADRDGWPRIVRAALLYVVISNAVFLARQVVYAVLTSMSLGALAAMSFSVIAALDLLARPTALITACLCLRGNIRARRWLVWALVILSIEGVLIAISHMVNVQRSNQFDLFQGLLNILAQTFGLVDGLLLPAGLAWFFSRPVVIGAMREFGRATPSRR